MIPYDERKAKREAKKIADGVFAEMEAKQRECISSNHRNRKKVGLSPQVDGSALEVCMLCNLVLGYIPATDEA